MAIKLSEKKQLLLVKLLLVVAALISLAIIFLISPLREIVFPPQNEQNYTIEDNNSQLSDENETDEESAAEEEAGGEPETLSFNRPPVIENFIIGPIDVMDAVRSGEAIPITFVEQPLWFTVIASDHEGEFIDFEIRISHGFINNRVRLDDNTLQFIWVSPSNSEGLIETIVNATVEVTAVDFSGGRDRAVINLAMTPEGSEGDEEPAILGEGFSIVQTYRVSATADLSGDINSAGVVRTGTIIVGDDDSNRQYKGYLTFSLAGITGIAADNITGAQIVFTHINRSGSPQAVGEFVDLKVFNYGPTLDSSDFAVGGTRFGMIAADSFTNGSTAQGSLVTEVRRAVSAGAPTLQVKMGLDAATNNNNAWDIFQFHPENVKLVIDYLE